MAIACVDASVAAKWVLAESDTEQANVLLAELHASDTNIVGPLHLPAELTSAVYKRLRDGALTVIEAERAAGLIEELRVRLTHPAGVARQALLIANQLKLKYAYDAFYLALGELLDCDVWTADRTLYAAAHGSFPRLRLLSDFEAGQD